ncbi:MAG: hypothetical protein ACRDUY_04060 [Nitriliruptorales bacterium]
MSRVTSRGQERPGHGGVGDGLPALPSGEPLLHRWFAIALVILVPAGLAVVVWAFLSIPETTIPPAARRPPGTDSVTHERGAAELNATRATAPGPDCADAIAVVGDASAHAAGRRSLSTVCQLLSRAGDAELAAARQGLEEWAARDGVLRFAVFELNGVDSSTREEDGRTVVELNAKFQFEPGERAAPSILHELVHIGAGMPGTAVTAEGELAAIEAQDVACRMLVLRDDPPRGCNDAAELLAGDDPLADIVAAGYQRGQETDS